MLSQLVTRLNKHRFLRYSASWGFLSLESQLQWNLNITFESQGTGKIYSLASITVVQRGFVLSWIFFIYFTIQKWSEENSSLCRGLNLSSQSSDLYTKVFFLRFALNQDSNLARLSSHFKITIKYVRRYWNMFTVTINPNEHNSYFPPTPPPRKKNSYFDRDGVHFKNTMTINALFTRIQTVLKPHICLPDSCGLRALNTSAERFQKVHWMCGWRTDSFHKICDFINIGILLDVA